MLRNKYVVVFMMLVLLCGCNTKENAKQQIDVFNEEGTNNKLDNYEITVDDLSMDVQTEKNEISNSEKNDKSIISYRGIISGESYEKGAGYDIQIIKIEKSRWKMVFSHWNRGTIRQTIEDEIDFDIKPFDISTPVTIVDIKNDGYMDYIIDYGILGKVRKGECIIWNSDTLKYEILEGYSKLCNAVFDTCTGMIYEIYTEGMVKTIRNQYVVDNNKMELVATMVEDYNNGDTRYTEKRKVDGEFVVVQEYLPKTEMSFEGWNMLMP